MEYHQLLDFHWVEVLIAAVVEVIVAVLEVLGAVVLGAAEPVEVGDDLKMLKMLLKLYILKECNCLKLSFA